MSELGKSKKDNLDVVELDLNSLSFYKKLFNWAGEGMIVVDQKGIILLVNHRITDLFGYSTEELIGNRLSILIPSNLKKAHDHHTKGYFSDPRARRMSEQSDLKGQKKDGSTFLCRHQFKSF